MLTYVESYFVMSIYICIFFLPDSGNAAQKRTQLLLQFVTCTQSTTVLYLCLTEEKGQAMWLLHLFLSCGTIFTVSGWLVQGRNMSKNSDGFPWSFVFLRTSLLSLTVEAKLAPRGCQCPITQSYTCTRWPYKCAKSCWTPTYWGTTGHREATLGWQSSAEEGHVGVSSVHAWTPLSHQISVPNRFKGKFKESQDETAEPWWVYLSG